MPLLGSGMQLICAGAALCLAGAASGELSRLHPRALGSPSALATGYLVVFGSLVAYSSYEWLIHHAPARLAGTYALVAVLLGWWLLAERAGGRTLLAAATIVASVVLLVTAGRRPKPAPSVLATISQPTRRAGWRAPATDGRTAGRS